MDQKSEYFAVNHLVDTKTLVASLATNFRDGSGVAAWATFVAFFGFGSLWLAIGLIFGVLVLSFIAPPILANSGVGRFSHPIDLVRSNAGPFSVGSFTFVTMFAAFVYASAQIFVGGEVIASLTGMSREVSLILLAAFTGFYVILGGYKSVTLTDKLQWLLILCLILMVVTFSNSSTISSPSTFFELDILTLISLCGLSAAYAICSGDIWQRILSSKSPEVARNGLLWTGPIYFGFSILMVIGMMKLMPESLPDGIEPFQALFDVAISGSTLSYVFGLLLIVALMSTLDTQVHYLSSSVANLSFRTAFVTRVTIARLVAALVLLLACSLAIFATSFLELFFGAVTIVTTLLPIYGLVFWGGIKHADKLAALSVMVGVIIYLVLFATGAFDNVVFTLIPGVVSIITFTLLILIRNILKKRFV